MAAAVTDARDISRIAYGFMASKALFAALGLDLFTRLAENGSTLESLSLATGVRIPRLEPLLRALCDLGLVVEQNGVFHNAPASEQYLVRGAQADFSDYYRYQIDRLIYPRMMGLGDCLSEQAQPGNFYAGEMADALTAEEFIRGQHAGSKGPAYLLAKTVDLSTRTHLLDVGGGSGAISHALCGRFPDLRATILDFSSVIRQAEGYTRASGLGARIDFVAGDAVLDPWPGPVDALVLSYLLSSIDGEAIPKVLAKAAGALESGGILIVHDFLHTGAADGRSLTGLWSLAAMALNPDAVMLVLPRLKPMMEAAGFADIADRELISDITTVVTCTRR